MVYFKRAEFWHRTGFDDIRLLTEFADKKDGTVQQSNISLSSFDGVRVSLTPALLPDGFTIEQK